MSQNCSRCSCTCHSILYCYISMHKNVLMHDEGYVIDGSNKGSKHSQLIGNWDIFQYGWSQLTNIVLDPDIRRYFGKELTVELSDRQQYVVKSTLPILRKIWQLNYNLLTFTVLRKTNENLKKKYRVLLVYRWII
jgi:hypothetical protein